MEQDRFKYDIFDNQIWYKIYTVAVEQGDVID